MNLNFKFLKQTKNIYIFLYIIILYTILSFISNEIIITEDFIISSYKQKFSTEQIHRILSLRESYGWISYILQVVLFALKAFFVSICISIGLLLADIKVSFKSLLKVVFLSEGVFILYTAIRMGLIYYKSFSSLEKVTYFSPGSLLSMFNYETLNTAFIYPLQVINIPQLVYFFALAFGLTAILKNHYFKNLKIVFSSYGTGLVLWIAIVVFAQLYLLNG